ncbi:MAG: hypothetical protein EPN17_17610 [Methylobacter sp.]|nr:MAG: hypothetical protein EPN17_17610 [Methylobacter sp.]
MARNSTTINYSHVLLVEGESDRGFFELVCKSLDLNTVIKVASPEDYQKDYEEQLYDTKQGALPLLADLLNELFDEEAPTQRLALIVDADKVEHGSGYQKTLMQVSKIANDCGFFLTENNTNGLNFKHNDGQTEFGLWIMPNNRDEGMLENFIKQCVKTDEQPLFAHAELTVQNLPKPKFSPHNTTKAEVATWLAWQKKPGHGLYHSLQVNLLDTDHALFQELTHWLKNIFI